MCSALEVARASLILALHCTGAETGLWSSFVGIWQRILNRSQGSTGVLKTGGVPTWTVNFGVGFAHPKILLDAVLRGQPT